MSSFKLNEVVPDFALKSVSGGEFRFSEERGKDDGFWQLLVYFRGSWCPACMEELTGFEDGKSYFEKHRVRLTTITHDKREDLEKMVRDNDFTFPVLIDEDHAFLKAYGVHFHDQDAPYEDHGEHGDPAYFLTDHDGKLLYQQRQTSPFGRPHPNELRKIIQYIKKNLK